MRNFSPTNKQRTGGAATTVAALFAVGSLVGAGVVLALQAAVTPTHAWAQQQAKEEKDASKEDRAVRLLRRMVLAEMRKAFVAREATLNADGRGTEQWVKRDPRRGIRRESIRPPGMIWIDNYRRSYRINTRENRVVESDSLLPRPDGARVQEFLHRFTGQLITPEVVGEDRVAGRSAHIVAVTGPATVRRFWIDKKTGLRLKTEEYNRSGKLLSSSSYSSVDLSPKFTEEDFRPPPDMRVVKDNRRRFDSLQAAEKAGVKVARPRWVPAGYGLRNVEALRDGRSVTLRYTNGIDVLSLTQFAPDKAPPHLRKRVEKEGSSFLPFPRGQRGYVWRDGERTFLLISSLSDDQVRRVAESLP
ncbi:MAG TPA: sigma-E factor regulatory protein RseB domain-containing protein [Armatimonadaceae bacterium]|nr:sigma-E factor regulatory protein RseB domain-containing protein [Armatimonadaceae bacterium]